MEEDECYLTVAVLIYFCVLILTTKVQVSIETLKFGVPIILIYNYLALWDFSIQ